MPRYDYKCETCGVFEHSASMTAPALSTCPICGAAVARVYGSVGIAFKGNGFYRNDSKTADLLKQI